MTKKIITLNEVKRNNLRSVLALLLRSEGLSRIEIAGILGCDNTTVSRAVRELIDRGIINTGNKNGSSNGRPRVTLRMNPAGPSLIGIALESDGVTGVLTDLKSEPFRVERIRFNQTPTKDEYLGMAAEIVRKLQDIAGERIAGFGATVFGSYYGQECILEKVAAMPALDGVKLIPFFSDITGKKSLVCDHAVAISRFLIRQYPELTAGTVMLVTAGKGLGVVIMEDGKPLFCRNHHGGEFGHTVRIPDGVPCACGRRGCLETAVSSTVLLRKYQEKLGQPATFSEFTAAFRQGNEIAVSVIKPAVSILSTAVAEQLNNYPVDKLVIAGDLPELGEQFEKEFRRQVTESVFSLVRDGLNFHFCSGGTADSLAIGASILAAEKYVADFE